MSEHPDWVRTRLDPVTDILTRRQHECLLRPEPTAPSDHPLDEWASQRLTEDPDPLG